MTLLCKICGSYAIDQYSREYEASTYNLCDVCYWRTKAKRKPLTEDQIKDCEKQSMVNGSLPFEQRLLFARAIERAHGIGEK